MSLLLLAPSRADAQNYLTPKFVASPKSEVTPAHYTPRPLSEAEQIQPIVAQQPFRNPGDEPGTVRTELPGPQRLFLRQSEAQFFDRIAQDMKKQQGGTRAIFPEAPVISKEKYSPRRYENMPVVFVEPSYVCHGRLLFEQPNFERTGYNFGILQPAIGLGVFYYDVALLPYHAFSDLHQCYDCSAGKCLPGDPAPLYLYRERFSWTGLAAQAGVMTGLHFLFPP